MGEEEAKRRLQASLEFLGAIKGRHLEKSCSRASVWGSVRQLLAKGEVFAEPSLDAPKNGKFFPDDVSLLDSLASSASHISFDDLDLYPVKIGEVHPFDKEPHLHFEVTGEKVEREW